MALNCPSQPGCELACEDFLTQNVCDAEYFIAIDCVLGLPASSFDCDPSQGVVYVGPGCETEIQDYFDCEGI
jgi:hypothetical protein